LFFYGSRLDLQEKKCSLLEVFIRFPGNQRSPDDLLPWKKKDSKMSVVLGRTHSVSCQTESNMGEKAATTDFSAEIGVSAQIGNPLDIV